MVTITIYVKLLGFFGQKMKKKKKIAYQVLLVFVEFVGSV